MLFAFDATPEDTTMTTKHENIIQRLQEDLSKAPEVKQATRCAKNLLDDVYSCVSHAGREINNTLDGLPKKGEMSPTAKAIKDEFERNCETFGRAGTKLGDDFKTYGVPLIRDEVVELQKHPELQVASVWTAGCALVTVAAPNPWLKGAAMAGTIGGALYVVGMSAVNRVDEANEKLFKAN